LNEKSEQAKAELQQEVKATQDEKDAVLTKLKQSEDLVQNLANEKARLKDELLVRLENNSTLEKQLEEAILKVSNLHKNLEKSQAEAACHIDDMSTKTKDMEKTIDLLSCQKTRLEEDLKIMIEACTMNLSFMTEFEDRVTQKISDHEARLVVLCQSLNEVSSRVSQLEILKRIHIDHIGQLEEKHTETLAKHQLLEEENLSANKEKAKLQKHVQDLEVQLQLAKQKLKVTEAESKCKEDSNTTTVEKLLAEIHHLEQLVNQFSGRVSLLEETLMQVKGHAESGVSKLADKFDELEPLFCQTFALFIDRSSTCGEELKILRKKLHDHLDEQKELVKENDEMAVKLREREKLVSEMVKSTADAEAKMVQLERMVAEKEEELAARVQEKREAIKQLSDAIVYHKNYSDDLVRYIRSHNRPRLPFCL
jgi:chromosome segregation ATPase